MRQQKPQPLRRTELRAVKPPHKPYIALKPTWKPYQAYLAEDKAHSESILKKYGVPPYQDCLKLMPPEDL